MSNPHFPALPSDPKALSGASRTKQTTSSNIVLDIGNAGEDLSINRHSVGQGGLSEEPTFDPHIQALKNLNVESIRIFLSEYFDVYPSRGVYNWEILDRTIKTILDCGAKPILAICFKPKTLYPEINENIVHPNSYKEWEQLIFEMVKRYNIEKKCGIEYWEVWNEPDIGEQGGCPGKFTPEDYCIFYEHTAKAVKKADPKAKVGGPALCSHEDKILPALLKHCREKNVPLDFVTWHIYNDDPLAYKNSMIFVRKLLEENKMKCEMGITEWNSGLFGLVTDHEDNREFQPCFVLECVKEMIEEGLDFSCFYHIRNINIKRETLGRFLSEQKSIFFEDFVNNHFGHLGMFDYQGIARPVYFSFKMLSTLLGKRINVAAKEGNVKVLAAYDEKLNIMSAVIWNFAVSKPKAEKVSIKMNMPLGSGDYDYIRYVLDVNTPSQEETAKIKAVKHTVLKDSQGSFKDSFALSPYGVTRIYFRKRMF
jgi:hypothetical protein